MITTAGTTLGAADYGRISSDAGFDLEGVTRQSQDSRERIAREPGWHYVPNISPIYGHLLTRPTPVRLFPQTGVGRFATIWPMASGERISRPQAESDQQGVDGDAIVNLTRRSLPPNVESSTGGNVIDAKAYLRLAVETLAGVDVDALDAAGRVAYAQALALVAIGARARHLEELPGAAGWSSAVAGRLE